MEYETEIINGHKAVVRHIFKKSELKPGTCWCPADGSNNIVTIDEIKIYPASDHEDVNWYEVYYSWEKNGKKVTHHKEAFSFQCRYCLILE